MYPVRSCLFGITPSNETLATCRRGRARRASRGQPLGRPSTKPRQLAEGDLQHGGQRLPGGHPSTIPRRIAGGNARTGFRLTGSSPPFNNTPADRRGKPSGRSIIRSRWRPSTTPRRIAGGNRTGSDHALQEYISFNNTPADRRGKPTPIQPVDSSGWTPPTASAPGKHPAARCDVRLRNYGLPETGWNINRLQHCERCPEIAVYSSARRVAATPAPAHTVEVGANGRETNGRAQRHRSARRRHHGCHPCRRRNPAPTEGVGGPRRDRQPYCREVCGDSAFVGRSRKLRGRDHHGCNHRDNRVAP